MSDVAIRVENLGKRYRIGAQQARYKTLRESLVEGVKALRPGTKNDPERNIWALKDVSFEVKQGEAIGVIGRNGAGKSTLLKVLAHITRPTTGRVEIHGRVGSLLEVGTGFHPELTGRDNIYLNGAILGMKRAEIDRKFDEIVAFAEIEKFLDTPAKHYSSGMYMRLAFAVAAHLEPEILLVDEVLAVGDADFQKKCLGKMGEVAKGGRTVLFVSHNLGAVNSLTSNSIWLKSGYLEKSGNSNEVINGYLASLAQFTETKGKIEEKYHREQVLYRPLSITNIWCIKNGKPTNELSMGDSIDLLISVTTNISFINTEITVNLMNSLGHQVIKIFSPDNGFYASFPKGERTIRISIGNLVLTPGQYFIDVGVNQSNHSRAYDVVLNFPIFTVTNFGFVQSWIDRPWGNVHSSEVNWEILPDGKILSE